jgi:hypothetical protein
MNKADKKINEIIAAKVNPPKVNATAVDKKKVSKA